MVTKNPEQTTTYDLRPQYNPITFGKETNINVQGGAYGVYGDASIAWAITNVGDISATGSQQYSKSSTGILLENGGSVTNQTGGTITGTTYSIYVAGGSGTVTNSGALIGAVALINSGVLVNQIGGSIRSNGTRHPLGVFLASDGSLTNAGRIAGVTGVTMDEAGHVINQSGGTISGELAGIDSGVNNTDSATPNLSAATIANLAGGVITGASGVIEGGTAATLTNAGAITGTTAVNVSTKAGTFALGDGLSLVAGGAVTNQKSGTIKGERCGVYIAGGSGRITNAGSIKGAQGSVVFAGAGVNSLTLESGSKLLGAAVGSKAAGATNALVLEGDGVAANVFENFNTLTVDEDADWTLRSHSTFGSTKVEGDLTVAAVLGGALTLSGGGIATFDLGFSGAVKFGGAGDLELSKAYTGKITGFGARDAIELLGLAETSTDFGFSEAKHVATLTLTESGVTETMHFAGSYKKSEFEISASGGATLVSFV